MNDDSSTEVVEIVEPEVLRENGIPTGDDLRRRVRRLVEEHLRVGFVDSTHAAGGRRLLFIGCRPPVTRKQ